MDAANRPGYQTDVTDEEWAFVAPYLALCREDAAQFRRLARDYERLAATLAGLHYLAFAILMLASLLRTCA